jgi:uncharacterized protein with LGFP repeats
VLTDNQGANLTVASDKSGNFDFGNVRVGGYSLSAQSSIGSANIVSARVTPNGVTTVYLVVPTPIDVKYATFGGSGGWLGAPTFDEALAPDSVGHFRHYRYGSIYWTSQTGAWEVHGRIRDKWSSLGWERSFLGYPLTDETPSTDGIGRYNHFQGGSVFWSPSTDAHEVHGLIRDYYASQGWERSSFGYPITDESALPSGYRYNQFQHCNIYWSPGTGVYGYCPGTIN